MNYYKIKIHLNKKKLINMKSWKKNICMYIYILDLNIEFLFWYWFSRIEYILEKESF